MKTFALKSGDIALAGNQYAMVSGIDRVKQQIGLCIRETYGTDRFHPRWGSVLSEWIGSVINRPGLELEIRSEIVRVIKNFAAAQSAAIDARAVRGLSPVQSPSEVVIGVTDIKIQQLEDRIIAKVDLRTAGGQTVTITTAPGGTTNGNPS